MGQKIPERLSWAVGQLKIAGDDRLLEIGCGRGVAVSLVCPRLTSGTITAIDRSQTAIDAARLGNEDHVAAGKVSFRQATLEHLDGPARSFDKIFAINVNLFWLDSAKGLDVVRNLLAPEGSLFLFYEPPSREGREKTEKGSSLPSRPIASTFWKSSSRTPAAPPCLASSRGRAAAS